VLDYCADYRRLGARTLFATHYHELTELESLCPGVVNLSTAVKKRGDEVIFLRRIVPGGADRSYGIEVAKLAGVPEQVIRRAKTVLAELEEQGGARTGESRAAAYDGEPQLSFEALAAMEAAERLRSVDLNTLTPIESMNLLFELKRLILST
jgi:DNA mismatch repair protein MutS